MSQADDPSKQPGWPYSQLDDAFYGCGRRIMTRLGIIAAVIVSAIAALCWWLA